VISSRQDLKWISGDHERRVERGKGKRGRREEQKNGGDTYTYCARLRLTDMHVALGMEGSMKTISRTKAVGGSWNSCASDATAAISEEMRELRERWRTKKGKTGMA